MAGSARPGEAAGYPGSKRTGGTPTPTDSKARGTQRSFRGLGEAECDQNTGIALQDANTTRAYFLARLFMAGNIRDGTGRYCFECLAGKKMKTGRDGTVK